MCSAADDADGAAMMWLLGREVLIDELEASTESTPTVTVHENIVSVEGRLAKM